MNCDIPLQLATTRTYLTVLIPCATVLIICIVLLFSGKMDTRLRQGAVAVVALVNVAFAGSYLYQFLSARVMINDQAVTVKSGMSSLTVNLSAIRWEAATDGTAMKFAYRENGTSIGDFAVGCGERLHVYRPCASSPADMDAGNRPDLHDSTLESGAVGRDLPQEAIALTLSQGAQRLERAAPATMPRRRKSSAFNDFTGVASAAQGLRHAI